MITTILNHQENHPIQLPALQKLADWLAKKVEAKTAPEIWNEVCIVLTDDEGIAEPNREYFGKDRPTDVISFRYDPVPGEDGITGDLIVNVDRAVQVGPDHKGNDYELALYIAHGFDHLTGAEDDTPEKKEAMLNTETGWLTAADKDGLLNELFK
jgi:probable rRNA maturation factor